MRTRERVRQVYTLIEAAKRERTLVLDDDHLFTDSVRRWIMGPMAQVMADAMVKLLLRTPMTRVPRALRPAAQALREARRRRRRAA